MRRRWRAAGVVLVATSALVAAAHWRAGAQLVPPSDSTTTAPPTTSPPTTSPPPSVVPKPTTTVARPLPTQPPRTTVPPPPPPPPSSTTTTVKPGSQVIPPEGIAAMNSIRRTPGNSTAALFRALQPLEDFGLTPQEIVNVGFGHFPVGGPADFSDDFLTPRFTPTFHTHKGNDIFADMGTPIRAPVDGTVRLGEDTYGGRNAYLTTSDGTFYYNAHLSDWPKDLPSGSHVKQGTIIGFVGNTGDAQGGATHDHFEIHPQGGAAVNPKPILDGWLAEAIANAPAIIASYQANAPKAIAAAGFIRHFDVGDQGLFSAPGRPPVGPLLWASTVNPAGGTLRLAQAEVAQAAGEVDWDQLLTREQEQAHAWQDANAAAAALLQPLTPPAIASVALSRGSS